jgi:hypothetical protein
LFNITIIVWQNLRFHPLFTPLKIPFEITYCPHAYEQQSTQRFNLSQLIIQKKGWLYVP